MKKREVSVLTLLKREVKRTSLNKTAKRLGYKSHNTIKRWLDLGIPSRAEHIIKLILGEKNNE